MEGGGWIQFYWLSGRLGLEHTRYIDTGAGRKAGNALILPLWFTGEKTEAQVAWKKPRPERDDPSKMQRGLGLNSRSQAGIGRGSCQPLPDPHLFKVGLRCSLHGAGPRCLMTRQHAVNHGILELEVDTDLRGHLSNHPFET